MLLAEYLRKRNLANRGDVGVEIEVEGNNLPHIEDADWTTVPDGSLRDGLEYIFNGAKPIENVPKMLEDLNEEFRECKSELSFSFRTSVHVHLNCLKLNLDQIKATIFAYLLLEPVLLTQVNKGRLGNRFCLGLHNAEGLMPLITNLFRNPRIESIREIAENDVRYASLGIASLRKHGTLEVRCMHGTSDPEKLVPWVNSLHKMKETAALLGDPRAVHGRLMEVGPEQFIKEFLAEEYYNPDCDELVYRNLSLSLDALMAFRSMPVVPEGIDMDDYDNWFADAEPIYHEV